MESLKRYLKSTFILKYQSVILLFFIQFIDFLATGKDKYPLVINDSEKFARKRHWPFLSGLKCFPSLKTGERQNAPLRQGRTS